MTPTTKDDKSISHARKDMAPMPEQDLYATLERLLAEFADACTIYGREAVACEVARSNEDIAETAAMAHAAQEASAIHEQIAMLIPAG